MICTTYFLTFFSELIPPTGYHFSFAFKRNVLLLPRNQKTKNDYMKSFTYTFSFFFYFYFSQKVEREFVCVK